jgi:hypothetical protein
MEEMVVEGWQTSESEVVYDPFAETKTPGYVVIDAGT